MSREKITIRISVTPRQLEEIKKIIGPIPNVDEMHIRKAPTQKPRESKCGSAKMKGF